MGKRGPHPKLSAAPAAGERPYAPRGLDVPGKAAWDSLCDDLDAAGSLARTDRKLIELFARTWALWDRVDSELSAECSRMSGQCSAPGDDGPAFPYRLANLHLSLSARLRQVLLDCGLSPSTRKPSDRAEASPWGAIIGGDHGGI